MFKNSEGYSDPTAGAAMSRIIKEYKNNQREIWRRQNEIKCRPKVYVVSRYAGDIEANVSKVIEYCKYVIAKRYIPLASHLIYPSMLQDSIPEERELGTMFGLALLAVCDEVWVFGTEQSDGMRAEIAEAKQLGKPVRYYNEEVLYVR